MKTKLVILNVAVLSGLAALVLTGQGNGPLDPPASPADGVYKTLDQVEPRTPIGNADLPLSITESGSYYLTENLHFSADTGNAIIITVPDVSIDLMGFALSSSAAVTGSGIFIDENAHRAAISNGKIKGTTSVTVSGDTPEDRDWAAAAGGFQHGVATAQTGNDSAVVFPRQCRFENLQIFGCRKLGLLAGFGGIVRQCSAEQNGAGGIVCIAGTVTDCVARYNDISSFSVILKKKVGSTTVILPEGILCYYGSASGCTAEFNASKGIVVGDGSAINCRASSNRSTGISANDGAVSNCVAISNGSGIRSGGGTVSNSSASDNNDWGIWAASISDCISFSNGGTGLRGDNIVNCRAFRNDEAGIESSGVVAFCTSKNNTPDFDAVGATRTGNNPTP